MDVSLVATDIVDSLDDTIAGNYNSAHYLFSSSSH
jgi:hypothetical protein